MKVSEAKPTNQPAAIAAARRNGRPLRIGGGPPNYIDNAAKALSENWKGITIDGSPLQGLFPIQQTGVSTQPIREAAEAFLASLDAEQRRHTLFPIDAPEWRLWSNIHRTIMRHGMPLFAMTDRQLDHAFALLKESLSAQGFQTARDIMRLNETVMEMTGKLDEFGEDLYWLSIMGTPSEKEPWGWQIDGHHLNVNFFVLGDQVTMTPAFLGSEPVHALSGKYAGTRVFKAEEARGLALMRSLTGDQRGKAVIGASLPKDLFTTAFRDNLELRYQGIRYDQLNGAQHDLLAQLVEIHVGKLRPGHSAIKLAETHSHFKDTYFAWIGGVEEDSVFYYRIHSPVLLVEFDHQAGQAFPQIQRALQRSYSRHRAHAQRQRLRQRSAAPTLPAVAASSSLRLGFRKRVWLTGASVCAAMIALEILYCCWSSIRSRLFREVIGLFTCRCTREIARRVSK